MRRLGFSSGHVIQACQTEDDCNELKNGAKTALLPVRGCIRHAVRRDDDLFDALIRVDVERPDNWTRLFDEAYQHVIRVCPTSPCGVVDIGF